MKFLASCLAASAALAAASHDGDVLSLEGGGTTNPSKFLWKVGDIFETRLRGPAKLGYRAIGSSTGQKELVGSDPAYQPLNDYGSGDIPITTERYDLINGAGRTVAHFPFVMGAIAIFYNGDNGAIPNDVQLDACTLALIFSGQITNWNDDAIATLNPGVALPDLAITVVHRKHGSSSTSGTTEYIDKATIADGCEANWGLGSGSTIAWFEGSTEAEGSGGVTAAIKATPGAIGYLDAGHGYGENLDEVALKNADGEYLVANGAEIAAAGKVAVQDGIIPANATDSFADVNLYNLPGATTWPITLISYLYLDVSPQGLTNQTAETYTERVPLLVALLEYINSDEGQELAADADFGFTGIPQEVRDLNAETIAFVKENNPGLEWYTFETSTLPLDGADDHVISSKRQSWATIQSDTNKAYIGDLGEDAPSLLQDFQELQAELAALRADVEELQDNQGSGVNSGHADVVFAGAVLGVTGAAWAFVGN